MTLLRSTFAALTLSALSAISPAQQPPSPGEPPLTADHIMALVAANQERSEAERAHYVYVQHARVLSRKGKTLMCKEITDTRVTPTLNGSHGELLKLDGRVLSKGKYINYTTPPPPRPRTAADADKPPDSLSITLGDDDRALVGNMRSSLTEDNSKDGINRRLFPLTTTRQADYNFQLVGRELRNGRDVFHIEFRPRDKTDFDWKGDAWIDITTFQPVLISTAMARKIPFAVRTLLGTNIPGLGFTVIYAPQPDGLWFPVSLGTEFKLHLLFFFSRQIIIDAENRDFQKTHVQTSIIPASELP